MDTDKALICRGARSGRRGLYEGRGTWQPKVEVPVCEEPDRWDGVNEEIDGLVKGEHCSSYGGCACTTRGIISGYWADAQNVNHQCRADREEPGAATAATHRLRRGGLGLVCGGLGHGRSLGLGREFNRRKRSERRET